MNKLLNRYEDCLKENKELRKMNREMFRHYFPDMLIAFAIGICVGAAGVYFVLLPILPVVR